MDPTNNKNLTEYQSEQIELIRKIHHFLINNLNQRITIESLSKQFLTNPTSLKTIFKDVYGTSIANHIKEHRLEKAAILLNTTSKNIGDIAYEVGYDSPSKFSTAFKDKYHVLPSKYRKNQAQIKPIKTRFSSIMGFIFLGVHVLFFYFILIYDYHFNVIFIKVNHHH